MVSIWSDMLHRNFPFPLKDMSRDASTGGSVVQQTSSPALPRPNVQKGGGGVGVATTSVVGGQTPQPAIPSRPSKRYITLNVFSLLLGGWIVPGSVLVHLPIHLNAITKPLPWHVCESDFP